MSQNIQVNMAFRADTNQAKTAIQELQGLLNKIAYTGSSGGAGFKTSADDIKQAADAAKQLQYHLNNAYNATTGNFDLSKLDKSLKTSGSNLSDLSAKLITVGPTGQKAFATLAQSIANADRPMLRLNKGLTDMWTTLKNSARWQISSNVLHGLEGTLNSAIGYAKDLNRSLTDIRVVTGASVDEMARFTAEANKAAKALSTTTVDYTDAALIYYQQGLTDREVKQRTDVTIKMANAAGVSAQTVSDQMTSIWNNFADGTKTLEYYADGITKLGAETASSTDEIIEGVQKFAAVTDTIGLSFEYATAALATVTDKTRESASVVGTAFRTIFSRLEGLSLGETLDDGTDLNKYSRALATVGVQIKDASGNMRDMDDILDDLGGRWQNLARDEQIALGQTVAGVRQYTQLIALMDNWDSFKQNVGRVETSEGTLQQQADIYAESWEAARDRVKAASEDIFNDLLNDKMFISFNNGFANILGGIDSVIEGMGGLKGIIGLISSLLLANFSHKIPQALDNLKYNFNLMVKGAEEAYKSINESMEQSSAKAFAKIMPDRYGEKAQNRPSTIEFAEGDNSLVSEIKLYNQVAIMKTKLEAVTDKLTDAERQQWETEIQIATMRGEELINLQKKNEALQKQNELTEKNLQTNYASKYEQNQSQRSQDLYDSDLPKAQKTSSIIDNLTVGIGTEIEGVEDSAAINANLKVFNTILLKIKEVNGAIAELQNSSETISLGDKFSYVIPAIEQIKTEIGLTDKQIGLLGQGDELDSIKQQFLSVIDTIDPAIQQTSVLKNVIASIKKADSGQVLLQQFERLKNVIEKDTISAKEFAQVAKKMGGYENINKYSASLQQAKQNADQARQSIEGVNSAIAGINPTHIVQSLERFSSITGSLGSVAMSVTSLVSAVNSLNDSDLNEWEKLSSIITSIGFATPGLISGLSKLNKEIPVLGLFQSNEKIKSLENTSSLKDIMRNTQGGITGNRFKPDKEFTEPLMKWYAEVKKGNLTLEEARKKLDESGIVNGKYAESIKENIMVAITDNSTKKIKNILTDEEITQLKEQIIIEKALQVAKLKSVAIMGGVAAAIAIVIALVKHSIDAYNADAIAAEKARASAEKLAEEYENVKQEYEDMIAAFDNYESATNALDDLIKGTEEYADALKDANREALDLINKYNLIKGEDYSVVDGQIIITEKQRKNIEDEKEKEVDRAYAQSLIADNVADVSETQAEITKQKRNFSYREVGTISSNYADMQRSREEYQKYFEEAVKIYQKNPEYFTEGSTNDLKMALQGVLGVENINDNIVNALIENAEKLDKLSESIDSNSESWDTATDVIAQAKLADNDKIQSSKYADQILSASGDIYQGLVDQKKAEIDSTGLSMEQVENYLKEQYDSVKGINTKNGGYSFKYKNNGDADWKSEEVSSETVIAAIAAAEALESLGASAEKLLVIFSDLADRGPEGNALQDFIVNKNFNASNKEEWGALVNSMDTDGTKGLTETEKAKAFFDAYGIGNYNEGTGELTFDEAANAKAIEIFGESAQTVYDKWISQIESTTEAWTDNYAKSLSLTGSETFSLQAKKNFEENLGGLNESQQDIYKDAIERMTAGLEGDELTTAMEALSEVDWSKTDSLVQAQEIMQALGHDIDLTSEEWDSFFEGIEGKTKALRVPELDISKFKSTFAEIQKILDSLKLGDTISPEQYEKLPSYLKEAFVELYDGTFMFTGSIEEAQEEYRNYIKKQTDEQWNKQIVNKQNLLDKDSLKSNITAFKGPDDPLMVDSNWDEKAIQRTITEITGKNYATLADAIADYEILDQATIDAFFENTDIGKEALQESYGQWAQSIEQLDQLVKDGIIEKDGEIYQREENRIGIQEITDEYGLDAGEIDQNEEYYKEAINKNIFSEDQKQKEYLENVLSEGAGSAEEMASYEKELDSLNEKMENYDKIARKSAVAQARLDKATEKVNSSFEEWNETLKYGNDAQKEQATAEIKKSMEDMLDLDYDSLSNDFVTNADNLSLMKQAAEGSQEALDELQANVAKRVIVDANLNLPEEQFDQLNGLIEQASAEEVKIGASINDTEFGNQLVSMLDSMNLTAEEMQDILDAVGYSANIDYDEVPITNDNWNSYNQEYDIVDQYGNIKKVTAQAAAKDTERLYFRVPKINREKTTFTGGSANKKPASSGGGGGSSKKTHEKKSDQDKTRYRSVRNQNEDLKANYDRINKLKDRAFGSARVEAIEDEIKATDALIDKQKEYIDEIEHYLNIDRESMIANWQQFMPDGPALEFDIYGNITNYDEIQDAMYNLYNSKAEQTMDEDEWGIFEKQYEQMEKYFDQYDETYDLLRDEEQAYTDLLNQRADLMLEKIQSEIDLRIEIAEDGLNLLEYRMEKLNDDAFKAAEAISLFSEKASLLYDQIKADREGLERIIQTATGSNNVDAFLSQSDFTQYQGQFTEAQIDAIREYRDNLLDLNSELDEMRKEINDKVLEVFDAWNEKLDDNLTKFDQYSSVLESFRNIIDIVGEDALGVTEELSINLGQATVDTSIERVKATKDAYDAMVEMQVKAEEELAEARLTGDDLMIKHWEDVQKQLTEEMNDAQSEFLSSWEDALDALATQFEMSIERIVKSFNESIYKGGLDKLSEDFDRQQELSDMMLDDYQKIYELSKLNRDVQKTIDDTDNLAGKQKLKKLLGEINALQAEGVEMSQYDLEYLQKTYDLRLAELELEEAQRAKNTVRLSRDNEGNWSYIYTQNTDAVDQAQQKYEDALYAMQDLSSNYIDEMSEKLISTSQEMLEALSEVRKEDFATEEEYYKEIAKIQDSYQEQLALQQVEMQKAVDNNKILYDTDWTNYHNATGYKISDTEAFATSFKDTMLGTLLGSEEDTVVFADIIKQSSQTLMDGMMNAASAYYTNLENAMNAAGTSTDSFAENLETNIGAITDASQKGAEEVKSMADQMVESFTSISDTVDAWQDNYGKAMEEVINSNLAVIESFNLMLEQLSMNTGKINVTYDINAGDNIDEVKEPVKLDTGGYTGAWGKSGRLAILHEKELVLNKQDTENFLQASRIMNALLSTIDVNAHQASLGFGNVVPATVNNERTDVLEQIVQITAEFPDATDRDELTAAFDTLINRASQYANRK